MKRLLPVYLSLCLALSCAGCGNITVRGAIRTGVVDGLVSQVELSTGTNADGSTVIITLVTFLENENATTIGFCGDQRTQFPLDQLVHAEFTLSQPCNSLLVITIR